MKESRQTWTTQVRGSLVQKNQVRSRDNFHKYFYPCKLSPYFLLALVAHLRAPIVFILLLLAVCGMLLLLLGLGAELSLGPELLPGLSVRLQQLVEFAVERVVALLDAVEVGVDLIQHGVDGDVLFVAELVLVVYDPVVHGDVRVSVWSGHHSNVHLYPFVTG